ncbi:MAG: hypothetical protein V4501_12285 [Pseudomonadota bacterium]
MKPQNAKKALRLLKQLENIDKMIDFLDKAISYNGVEANMFDMLVFKIDIVAVELANNFNSEMEFIGKINSENKLSFDFGSLPVIFLMGIKNVCIARKEDVLSDLKDL